MSRFGDFFPARLTRATWRASRAPPSGPRFKGKRKLENQSTNQNSLRPCTLMYVLNSVPSRTVVDSGQPRSSSKRAHSPFAARDGLLHNIHSPHKCLDF
jgi:hypothetical protein